MVCIWTNIWRKTEYEKNVLLFQGIEVLYVQTVSQVSKIWAPHGMISSQIRNYTKLKFELKNYVSFEQQGITN